MRYPGDEKANSRLRCLGKFSHGGLYYQLCLVHVSHGLELYLLYFTLEFTDRIY